MIPQRVIAILDDVGQVAAELSTEVEGHREFITVSKAETSEIDTAAFRKRFPYLGRIYYTVWRFRVVEKVIEDDIDIWEDDMIDLQKMYVSNLEEVEAILQMWQFDPANLLPPNQTEVPI